MRISDGSSDVCASDRLPGMVAALTPLPVLGVPIESHALKGRDSLLSIVQMPAGVPVGTLALGRAGAVNAPLLAASIQLGRASCRERVFQDVWVSVGAGSLQNKKNKQEDAKRTT